jgi:hypothetical protein
MLFMKYALRLRSTQDDVYFIYAKSSISVLFPQMTFVLNFIPNLYDLKRILFAGVACHISYNLISVGFILETNQLTTKDTKEHKGF